MKFNEGGGFKFVSIFVRSALPIWPVLGNEERDRLREELLAELDAEHAHVHQIKKEESLEKKARRAEKHARLKVRMLQEPVTLTTHCYGCFGTVLKHP
jgi:hypothetical protein